MFSNFFYFQLDTWPSHPLPVFFYFLNFFLFTWPLTSGVVRPFCTTMPLTSVCICPYLWCGEAVLYNDAADQRVRLSLPPVWWGRSVQRRRWPACASVLTSGVVRPFCTTCRWPACASVLTSGVVRPFCTTMPLTSVCVCPYLWCGEAVLYNDAADQRVRLSLPLVWWGRSVQRCRWPACASVLTSGVVRPFCTTTPLTSVCVCPYLWCGEAVLYNDAADQRVRLSLPLVWWGRSVQRCRWPACASVLTSGVVRPFCTTMPLTSVCVCPYLWCGEAVLYNDAADQRVRLSLPPVWWGRSVQRRRWPACASVLSVSSSRSVELSADWLSTVSPR